MANQIMSNFCAYVRETGGCDPQYCGVDTRTNFFFGHTVDGQKQAAFLEFARANPALSEVMQTRKIVQPKDVKSLFLTIAVLPESFHSGATAPESAAGNDPSCQAGVKLGKRLNKGHVKCGVCYEPPRKKGVREWQGVNVCFECEKSYLVAKYEEYEAITYEPLKIRKDDLSLPGHPKAGTLIVTIKAVAPERLSTGCKVYPFELIQQHYLPDNEIGRELLDLLEILHERKLIYKIGENPSVGSYGIQPDFPLKTEYLGAGYPDFEYPIKALNAILNLVEKNRKLEKDLNISRLAELIYRENRCAGS